MLFVIVGPAGAGKTTWVMEHAKPHDIVIDFDRLAVALAGPGADSHQHPKALRDVTFRARSGAIQAALLLGTKATVYLIHAQPNTGAMAQYVKAGAEVMTIDPGRAVVEQRCREERSPATLAIVGKWYRWKADQDAPPAVPSPPSEPVTQSTQALVGSRSW